MLNKKLKFLNVLILEDLKSDVDLITRYARIAVEEMKVYLAPDKEQYLDALNNFHPDIILADYLLPGFDGIQALHMAQEYLPLVPFVFVTGTLNDEELAAQTVLSGASEFVLKNNLKRLPEVILKVMSPEFASRQLYNSFKDNRNEVDQFKKEIEAYEQRLAEMKAQLAQAKKEER